MSSSSDTPFSVPQSSICGPVFYTIHASTLGDHIAELDVSLMGYADDHSLYGSFDPGMSSDDGSTIGKLEPCLVSANDWMNQNRLKMNTSKTEFMIVGHRTQTDKCYVTSINVCGDIVTASSTVRYLGVLIDRNLSFEQHIKDKYRIASLNVYSIRQIRSFISRDICHQLVHSLVLSHIDYVNALFVGLPGASTLAPLYRVQVRADKLVLNRGR